MADRVTNEALGDPVSLKEKVLTTGASIAQDFRPVKQICAHLNAFHVYASEPGRCVEANHYCSHVNDGIEYMVTPRLYATLPPEERRLWHSHVFEVKSGILAMPGPEELPSVAWEAAETKEMEDVVGLYGKTYHFWQVDRGDKVPFGAPQLMMSFTEPSQLPEKLLNERDERFGVDHKHKAHIRSHIVEPSIHEGVPFG
ncbi:MAG: hypothetical protein M1832_004302 [Thelocarpon impressellum]|nr:MAG: hypothetical protein M1832_004302 [Thelocarpon impressellum]